MTSEGLMIILNFFAAAAAGIPSVVSEDPTSTTDEDDDDMTWLKTTVYSVIGCAVGIVLFISVVVIFFFRLKMRKAERQRAMRALERLRQANQASNNTPNSTAAESEPFISSSGGNFGNIYVNVNNGVQYVPGRDAHMGLVSPPSYSEVVQESRRQQGSPPPPYSTFDRNTNILPSRTAEISTSTSHLEQNRVAMAELPPVSYLAEASSTRACGVRDSDNQISQNRHHNRELEHGELTSDSECNTTLHRQKQPKIEVRDGQIVLAGDVNASTASDVTGDVVLTSDDGAKPANQLIVRDGQIIFTNCENAEGGVAEGGMAEGGIYSSNRDTSGQTNQGQLQVKDGQLIFKEGV